MCDKISLKTEDISVKMEGVSIKPESPELCQMRQKSGSNWPLQLQASVMSVTNVLFKQTNLLSEWSDRDHFMNWFVPFLVQLSSAASMLARSGTAETYTEKCEDVIHVRAVILSWFANLLHTENCR